MRIFYTIGNTNLSTVKLVAKAIKEKIIEEGATRFDKIVLFNTRESHEGGMLQKQIDIYREYINPVRFEEIMLNEYGTIEWKEFTAVFEDSGEKFIDLSNGPKTTTALLYLAASLISIENIYLLSIKVKDLPADPILGQHYDYIKLSRFGDLSGLAKISYFDLIYYIDEVNEIFGYDEGSFLLRTKKSLETAIYTFFSGDSYRSVISDATIFVEVTISYLLDFLIEYKPVADYAKKNKIFLSTQKDPLGAISYFYRSYSKYDGTDKNIMSLITLSGLLSALKNYRNIAAHSGNIAHNFTVEEARIVLNMVIEALRRMRSNNIFWNSLKKKR
jgi:hypothetical protein